MIEQDLNSRRPDRGRRLGLALASAVVMALLAVTALSAAPAGAKPDAGAKTDKSQSGKEQPGRGGRHGTETTTETAEDESIPTLRRTALRVAVTTTSDWVWVDLPGYNAGHVVVGDPDGRHVVPSVGGVEVRGPARVLGSITVDVVTEVPQSFDNGAITVAQGGIGKSTVEVTNITDEPSTVATITTSWSKTTRTVGVTAESLLGSEQLEWVRADSQRRVLAFTYPWFGDWAETDPRLSVHPSDPWHPGDQADALAMAEQARANGIDGFVMSFAGGKANGLPLRHSLEAAAATGGTATVLIETVAAGSAAVAEQWIREALAQADHPAFQRHDGVPVMFAFATGTLKPAEWTAITDRLAAEGTPVRIIADTWQGTDGPHAGHYRYSALFQSSTDEMTTEELTEWNRAVSRGLRAEATLGSDDPGLVVATVQPGWDDRLLRGEDRLFVERDGTATYDDTWRAAIAGEPDWVVVTSWNEWYEGTGIAPSVEYGSTALEATEAWAPRFRG